MAGSITSITNGSLTSNQYSNDSPQRHPEHQFANPPSRPDQGTGCRSTIRGRFLAFGAFPQSSIQTWSCHHYFAYGLSIQGPATEFCYRSSATASG